MRLIVKVFKTEQRKDGESPYLFSRKTTSMLDAPIFEGTGRNVKIFDMMANSLPVVTNKDLSSYGLKSGHHYILVNNIKDWQDELIKLEDSYQLRKLIAFNGWSWVNENCNDKHVFNSLLKKLDAPRKD